MTDNDEKAAQSALSGWGTDKSDATDKDTDADSDDAGGSHNGSVSESVTRTRDPFDFPTISEDAVFTIGSCPWCLEPASKFSLKYTDDFIGEPMRDPLVSCSNCSASIPVEEDWYQRGEKVCVDFVAQEYQGLDTEPVQNND